MVVQLYNEYLKMLLYNWYGQFIKGPYKLYTPFFLIQYLLIKWTSLLCILYGIFQTLRIAFLHVVYNLSK